MLLTLAGILRVSSAVHWENIVDGITSRPSSKFIVTNPDENPELRAEKFTIQQGTLEMSNASVINEMINTINTSRNYESLSKLVKENGQMLSTAISVGRVRVS